MIRFLKRLAASVATPPTGKVTLFVESSTGEPSYKDDAGTVTSMVGATGAAGPTGAAGQGVPTGGTAGQVLEKIDGADYNTQWATPAGAAVSSVNGATGAVALSFDNMIINGQFNINQRQKSGTVTLAAGIYGHDRWKAGASGCTYTFASSAGVTTLTITAGSLIQVVEGLNVRGGTHVLSWTGTAQGKFSGGSYSASGVTGTLTGGADSTVEFNTGTLTSVQLTLGSDAQPFISIGDVAELTRCQRYCFRFSLVSGISTVFMSQAIWQSATNGFVTGNFPNAMRAAPTLVMEGAVGDFQIYDVIAAAYSVTTAITGNAVTSAGFYLFSFSTASGGTAGRPCYFATTAQTANSIRFEAEL